MSFAPASQARLSRRPLFVNFFFGTLALLLTGGDDYELVFAADAADRMRIEAAGAAAGTPVTRIGRLVPGAPAVVVRADDGTILPLARGGWSHF